MRNWITFLMTLLAGSASYVNAGPCCTDLTFEAGYRRDDLSFSVQVPECDPIFKTRSRFKEIDIFQLGLRGQTNLGCNFFGRAGFSVGWILDGDYSESTNLLESAETPFSGEFCFETGTDNIIDGRFVIDFNLAIGYPFYFCDCTMYIAPVVGYAFDEQNLEIEDSDRFDFTEIASSIFAPESYGDCCTDKFVSRWYGPFIGLDFSYRPCGECWSIFAQLEYHYARHKIKRHEFTGFSDFNDFDSTSRHAHGWVFAAGADYAFCSCWTVGFDVKVQDWSATREHRFCHSEYGFFSSGSNDRYKTHADWRSFAVNLTVGRCF